MRIVLCIFVLHSCLFSSVCGTHCAGREPLHITFFKLFEQNLPVCLTGKNDDYGGKTQGTRATANQHLDS